MTNDSLLDLISQNEQMMAILKIISDLNLSDCWLAAGSIRNFVLNSLSGFQEFDDKTDIDVVYFDTERTYEDTLFIQKQLEAIYPIYKWEIKNQKDMHIHSPNTVPYQSGFDAIRKYPKTCTAIAVRFVGNQLGLYAPYGLTDME